MDELDNFGRILFPANSKSNLLDSSMVFPFHSHRPPALTFRARRGKTGRSCSLVLLTYLTLAAFLDFANRKRIERN
jgi:hypothetical protein